MDKVPNPKAEFTLEDGRKITSSDYGWNGPNFEFMRSERENPRL